MYYFSYISHSYTSKNRLEEAVSKVLNEANRMVVHADKLEDFKTILLRAIEICNQEHPRCKPLHADLYKPAHSNDYHLHMGGGICNFHIYASKEITNESNEQE